MKCNSNEFRFIDLRALALNACTSKKGITQRTASTCLEASLCCATCPQVEEVPVLEASQVKPFDIAIDIDADIEIDSDADMDIDLDIDVDIDIDI